MAVVVENLVVVVVGVLVRLNLEMEMGFTKAISAAIVGAL